MGSSLQLLYLRRWEVLCICIKMKLLVLVLSSALVHGGAVPGHSDNGVIEHQQHEGPHCHNKKDQVCHKKPKHSEHEECYVDYEIILDVTYIESCEYIKSTHCEEEAQTVLHSSQIVGQDSKVVDYYQKGHHGSEKYYKRSAEPSKYARHGGYSTPHKCHDKMEKQCKKDPVADTKKIPKTICKKIVNTIFIEECEEIIRTVCDESHEQYFSSQHIAGHESEKVAHSGSAHEEYHQHSYHV